MRPRTDKLIALFITAFWCGVCQRLDETALSSDEVRLLLNAYFVPIRVEEGQRPTSTCATPRWAGRPSCF
jgi:uncharacterized protein YyaL (SSP411 family)